MTLERLHSLRGATDRISQYLREQVQKYLDALRGVLLPQRVLGQHVEHPGRTAAPQADRVWGRLTAKYREIAGKPFGLSAELRSPLPPIDPQVELYPWEYVHEATYDGATHSITVACPAKWVLSYRSGYTLSEVRQALATGQAGSKDRVQKFVVHALVMREVVHAFAGMHELLDALRLKVGEEESPLTGELPFTTLTSSVESTLPADDVVVPTTQITGVPRFTEIIAPDTVTNLRDPLREKLSDLLQQA